MKKWKKNLMAAAVLVTVCAGIYLNWLYTEDQAAMDLTDTLDASKVLSSDTLVMSTDELAGDNGSISDYFAAVRLSRQEARDSAVTLLQEAMAYSEETDAQQTNVQLESIVQDALCEAQIESLNTFGLTAALSTITSQIDTYKEHIQKICRLHCNLFIVLKVLLTNRP